MIDQYVTDHFPTAIAPQRSLAGYAKQPSFGSPGEVHASNQCRNLASSPRAVGREPYFQIEGQSALHSTTRASVAYVAVGEIEDLMGVRIRYTVYRALKLTTEQNGNI